MIHASSLASPNIRHAFFTRAGGVSSGIYESLNGGIGSKDAPENVRENRARMATALGVAPAHLVSCYQIHSPDVIVATEPWTRENHATRRRDRDESAGPCGRGRHGRLRPGPVRGRGGRHRRCGACRLERRADRRARGDRYGNGKARRYTRAHSRRDRAADPAAELRGRAGVRRSASSRKTMRTGGSSSMPPASVTRCSTCPATSGRGSNALKSQASRTSGYAPTPIRRASSVTAAPRIAASRIMAAT